MDFNRQTATSCDIRVSPCLISLVFIMHTHTQYMDAKTTLVL